MPAEVFVDATPYDEKQSQDREIDDQKRKDDPDFKGAFHEKKSFNQRKKFAAAKGKAAPKKATHNNRPGKKAAAQKENRKRR